LCKRDVAGRTELARRGSAVHEDVGRGVEGRLHLSDDFALVEFGVGNVASDRDRRATKPADGLDALFQGPG